MKKLLYIHILMVTCLPQLLFAQTDSLVWISGSVIDSDSHHPVPFANIASYKQHMLYATDSIGHFYFQLPVHDSIKIVILGYKTKVFLLDSLTEDADNNLVLPVSRTSIMLDNIDIKLKRGFWNDKTFTATELMDNLHLPADIIPYDKSKDIIPASVKPVFKYDPPVVAFFFHPVSFVNYYAGKREKEKRKMVKLLKTENSLNLMSRDLIKEVSGLEGEPLNAFIIFCNKNVKLSPKETIFSVSKKVFLALEDYNKRFTE